MGNHVQRYGYSHKNTPQSLVICVCATFLKAAKLYRGTAYKTANIWAGIAIKHRSYIVDKLFNVSVVAFATRFFVTQLADNKFCKRSYAAATHSRTNDFPSVTFGGVH